MSGQLKNMVQCAIHVIPLIVWQKSFSKFDLILTGRFETKSFNFRFLFWSLLPICQTKHILWRASSSWSVGGNVAQLVEYRTGTPPTQVRIRGASRDFSSRVNFQCRLSHGVRTPTYSIARIYICVHVKDPVVPVRVRWIMETLLKKIIKTACTIGLVARLCRN